MLLWSSRSFQGLHLDIVYEKHTVVPLTQETEHIQELQ